MTQQHPITPPPELVDSIWNQFKTGPTRNLLTSEAFREAITKAARWGADQELEACCEYLMHCAQWEPEDVDELRTARRPKPPSLKEQALEQLDGIRTVFRVSHGGDLVCDIILRALEQLDD